MPLLTLATFDNAADAHVMRSKLESEEIPCFLFDEHSVTINPLYNITLGGIKLKVDERDVPIAMEIIEAYKQTKPTNESNEVIQCPSCGSEELYSSFNSIKGIKAKLTFLFYLLLAVYPAHLKRVYKCKSCGTEFSPN